ncbi:MAG: hypothetical protein JNJ54_21070 [Myxococcaceae bacterium]|nr:hypothetical protein [Myxococcaceae bacterium]
MTPQPPPGPASSPTKRTPLFWGLLIGGSVAALCCLCGGAAMLVGVAQQRGGGGGGRSAECQGCVRDGDDCVWVSQGNWGSGPNNPYSGAVSSCDPACCQ